MDTPAVMQRENETGRVVVHGKRTDDGTRCTLIVVREVGGTYALYPHGDAQLGVRLATTEASTTGRFLTPPDVHSAGNNPD